MHRTPEPPSGGGSRSFDKLAWRPTHGAYLALAKQAQEACALRRPQGRPDGHAGAPSWRGRGGARIHAPWRKAACGRFAPKPGVRG